MRLGTASTSTIVNRLRTGPRAPLMRGAAGNPVATGMPGTDDLRDHWGVSGIVSLTEMHKARASGALVNLQYLLMMRGVNG